MAATASSLPLGTRLGEFELTGVLGEGGFSVVYVALDYSLERTVAIKEYMPSAIAMRQPDGVVLPRSPKHEETFKAGLASFVNEARLLAHFNHPALIHIHRAWEQNGTAYMAMQYCLGRTLRQISQINPTLVKNEGWLKATFTPILDALELLHAHSCFHRDISPDNILLLENGAPILLDFGAARQVIGDMTQALTVILKPGFAPIEQYADDSSLQQGAWTDVYGVGAVLYFLLMGKPPVASVARLVKDPMVKLVDMSDLDWVSPSFRRAIDRALAVHPDQRIRSIAELRDALQIPTFRPESQFGGVFPIPPTVVPKTVPGEDAPLAGPLVKHETAHDPQQTPADIVVPSDHNASFTTNANPRPRKTRLVKHPWVVLIAGLGLVAMFVAIGLLNQFWDHSDHFKSSVANKNMKQKPSSLTMVPASAQELLNASSSASAAQDTIPNTSSSETKISALVASEASQAPTMLPKSATTPNKGAAEEKIPTGHAAKPAEKSVQGLDVQFGSMSSTHTSPKLPASSSALSATAGGGPPSEVATPVVSARHEVPAQQQKNEQPKLAVQTQNAFPANNQQEGNLSSPPPAQPASMPLAFSTVRFSIRPWGDITVDGQKKGSSPPLTHLQLPLGNHTVVITNGDLPPVTKDITVTNKEDIVISHRFGDE